MKRNHTRLPQQRRKSILRAMTARRLGGSRSKRAAAALIRERHQDAPTGVSYYELFEWFCQHAPLPPDWKASSRERHRSGLAVCADAFLASYEWRQLRMEVLVERGSRCECCGATPADGHTAIHVDHVKPRRLFPQLALDKSNLQILCAVCNHGKGNWNQTDWRAETSEASTVLKPRLVKR